MKQLFLDFETYYDNEYSLKKMTAIEYILDPRFEVLTCGFAEENGATYSIDGQNLPAAFAAIDWDNTDVISHNAQFDALILAFRYGVYPKRCGCTLSMAQNWIFHQTGSVSLAACAKRYGLQKMDTVHKMVGVNYQMLLRDPVLHGEVRRYAASDADLCRQIYVQIMAAGFPPEELDVIDWTIRMAARPQFEIDPLLVAEHLGEVLAKKQELLDNAGLENRDPLMQDDTLAASLLFMGVDPVPRKVSKTTGKERWAFAKTDKDFVELLDHENPDVQALVAARLGHKSTGEQTRCERFLAVSRVTSGMPIPLKYSGAHTHRFSGNWKLNMQNLANGSKLRDSLKAPKGKLVVSVDASQIEARINAEQAGETWLTDAFRAGRDVYADFAGVIYNRVIIKQLDKVERTVGKVGILSLGYGASWPVFQAMLRNRDKIQLSDQMAAQTVNVYRSRCPMIEASWKNANNTILPLMTGDRPYQWGCIEVQKEKLILPNGNALRYHGLKYAFDEQYNRMAWTYMRGNKPQRIYGAKTIENVCQALAFVHIADVAMRIFKMTEGLLWPAHQVHDELIYVVDEKLAEQVRDLAIAEMSKSPFWMPNVPLAAEGNMGDSYGAC